MKNKFSLESRNLGIKVVLQGKYTVLQGDSGTGKSRLAYLAYLAASGLCKTDSDVPVFGVFGSCPMCNTIESALVNHRSVIIVDEDITASMTHAQWDAIQKSDNAYIFISRDRLPCLPYSVFSIMSLSGNARHKRMVPVFTRSVLLRGRTKPFATVYCEDSGVGAYVTDAVLSIRGYKVTSAGGKDALIRKISSVTSCTVIADLAGFGSCIADYLLLTSARGQKLYLVDSLSFEHELLSSLAMSDFIVEPVLDTLLNYRSEEEYYTFVFDSVLFSAWGKHYIKGSKALADALILAFNHVRGVQGRLRFIRPLYPELKPFNCEIELQQMTLD